MKLPKDVKIIKGDHGNVRARMEREDVVYQRKAGKNLHIRFIYPQQDRVERKYPLIMHIQGSAWFEQNLNDHLLILKKSSLLGMWLPLWNICLFLMGFSQVRWKMRKQPCVISQNMRMTT